MSIQRDCPFLDLWVRVHGTVEFCPGYNGILVNVYRDKEQLWHGHGYDDLEDALIAVNEEVRRHLPEDDAA